MIYDILLEGWQILQYVWLLPTWLWTGPFSCYGSSYTLMKTHFTSIATCELTDMGDTEVTSYFSYLQCNPALSLSHSLSIVREL